MDDKALRNTVGCLTKADDVKINRYRKSLTKIKVGKIHILRCMGPKYAFYEVSEFGESRYLSVMRYDILSLNETGPWPFCMMKWPVKQIRSTPRSVIQNGLT